MESADRIRTGDIESSITLVPSARLAGELSVREVLALYPLSYDTLHYVGQGDGSRTRSQGSTTPSAEPLTPPPNSGGTSET